MEDVSRRLEKIIEEVEAAESRPKGTGSMEAQVRGRESTGVINPWSVESAVGRAFVTFASVIDDPVAQSKLEDLSMRVESTLGTSAVDPTFGIFNAARLYRFLRKSQMEVHDALAKVVINFNARS